MNLDEVQNVVRIVGGTWPTWRPNGDTVAMWAKGLEDLDTEGVLAVLQALVLTEEFPPSIALIRRRYAENAGITAPTATEAWAEVRLAIARHGRGGGVEWSHPSIAEAVAMIGWLPLCNSDNADTIRAQFRRAYEEQATKRDRRAVASMEIGPSPEQVALPAPAVDPELSGIRRSMELTARRDLGLVCETCHDAGFHDVDGNATACSCPLGAQWRDRLSVRSLPVSIERTAVPDHLRAFAESHAVCDLSADRIERTPVVASSVVADDAAFVEGLRQSGWSEPDITAELKRMGRVREHA